MPNKRFYFHTTCFFIVTLNGTIVLICLVYFSNSEVFMDTQQICESLRKLKLLLAEKKNLYSIQKYRLYTFYIQYVQSRGRCYQLFVL